MDRSRLGRGLALLAVTALAVAVVSPAFSAATLTKSKVKKIAKKQVNKLVPGIAIEESELVRFGPVKMSSTSPEQTLGTWGPFTVKLQCVLELGDVVGRAIIETTEAGSNFSSGYWSDEDPFDPADGPIIWAQAAGGYPPGGSQYSTNQGLFYPSGYAASPSGTHLNGAIHIITNFGGSDCVFTGWTFAIAPR